MLLPIHHFEYGSLHRYSNMCPLTCTFQSNIIVIDDLLVSMFQGCLRNFLKPIPLFSMVNLILDY